MVTLNCDRCGKPTTSIVVGGDFAYRQIPDPNTTTGLRTERVCPSCAGGIALDGTPALWVPVPDDVKAKRLEEAKEPRHFWPCMATVYAHLLIAIKAVGRQHGYAIAVHGSMTTDFDVVAVPWIDDAADARVLAEAVRVAVNGAPFRHEGLPTAKPHGRLAWSIFVGGNEGGPYIDFSVTPRVAAKL